MDKKEVFNIGLKNLLVPITACLLPINYNYLYPINEFLFFLPNLSIITINVVLLKQLTSFIH